MSDHVFLLKDGTTGGNLSERWAALLRTGPGVVSVWSEHLESCERCRRFVADLRATPALEVLSDRLPAPGPSCPITEPAASAPLPATGRPARHVRRSFAVTVHRAGGIVRQVYVTRHDAAVIGRSPETGPNAGLAYAVELPLAGAGALEAEILLGRSADKRILSGRVRRFPGRASVRVHGRAGHPCTWTPEVEGGVFEAVAAADPHPALDFSCRLEEGSTIAVDGGWVLRYALHATGTAAIFTASRNREVAVLAMLPSRDVVRAIDGADVLFSHDADANAMVSIPGDRPCDRNGFDGDGVLREVWPFGLRQDPITGDVHLARTAGGPVAWLFGETVVYGEPLPWGWRVPALTAHPRINGWIRICELELR